MTSKNINVLMDSELEQVAGGTLAETKQFINSYMNYAKRSGAISQGEINVIKALPIEQQADLFMAGIAKQGGLVSLRTGNQRNQYLINGQPVSHSQLINFLDTH